MRRKWGNNNLFLKKHIKQNVDVWLNTCVEEIFRSLDLYRCVVFAFCNHDHDFTGFLLTRSLLLVCRAISKVLGSMGINNQYQETGYKRKPVPSKTNLPILYQCNKNLNNFNFYCCTNIYTSSTSRDAVHIKKIMKIPTLHHEVIICTM